MEVGWSRAAQGRRRVSGDQLSRLLGGPGLEWIVRRARDRLSRGRPLTGTITLSDASEDQRRAVERLTGRRAGSGSSLSVSLDEVDRIVRLSGAAAGGLAEAVVLLGGPVDDLRAARAAVSAAWEAAFASLDEVIAGRPELAAWRAWLDATGLVRRLVPVPEAAGVLLGQVADAIRRLPSSGIPIGRLAAECCGDAHAFDEGRPAGTLVLSAARALAAGPAASAGFAAQASRREAWAAVGVYLDDLSSLVTCLGLAGDTRTPVGRVLAACREAGQPATLTLRQLRCHTDPLPARLVRVCENPVVLAAAADEHGSQCPPMVCVSGHPSAAGWRLLELLAASGARLEYHGDFDWGGVRIASAVMDRVGARPWRYDSAAYLGALSTLRPDFPRAPLTGEPAVTPWDPPLADVMRSEGIRVEEELVIDVLMSDLSPVAGRALTESVRSPDGRCR
jgi:uncharacterized protein (TIGR02679 family)